MTAVALGLPVTSSSSSKSAAGSMMHHHHHGLRPYRGGGGRGGGSSHDSCSRWVRWVMPIVLTALLSSYLTYLVMYSMHAGQHSFHSTTPGSSSSRSSSSAAPEHSTLDSSTAAKGSATPAATKAAATTAGRRAKAGPGLLSHPKYAPQDSAVRWVNATGRRMRVAVVNEAPYHLEVVAGLLHVLATLPVDVTWYQAGQVTAGGALSPTDLLEATGFTQLLGYLPAMQPRSTAAAPCDFAVLVSPEYFEAQTKAFLAAAKPVTVVALAHNGMNGALQRLHALHPRMHFSALSPHVAAAARHVLHLHMHWMLPTFPFVGRQAPCTAGSSNASACMDGFSLQGSFEPARRNYTRLWRQVQSGLATGTLPTKPPARRFHLHLVGRGDVSALRIPKDVAGRLATVHPNLRFPQYYDQLQHSHALLMLLGNINYLIQKMSSTVVSSLMTSVPIIADARVLASYTFLQPEHVFVMGPKETELDVMQRVLRMRPSEVFAVRQRVSELAAKLNKRSTLLLQAFMPLLEDVRLAPPLA